MVLRRLRQVELGEDWPGENQATRTAQALEPLVAGLAGHPLVWGGDWNHALYGPETAGSAAGREHLVSALAQLGLRTLTHHLTHRLGGGTIDHIAVPQQWCVDSVVRIPTDDLSDHDGYVAEVRD